MTKSSGICREEGGKARGIGAVENASVLGIESERERMEAIRRRGAKKGPSASLPKGRPEWEGETRLEVKK